MTRFPVVRLSALVALVLALTAASCGTVGGTDAAAEVGGEAPVAAPQELDDASGDDASDDASGDDAFGDETLPDDAEGPDPDDGSEDGATSDSRAATTTTELVVPDEPVRGGRLVYALEADTVDGFTHYGSACGTSCRMVLRSVADPLFRTDVNGEIQPVLATSITQLDDTLTRWELEIRDGVVFADGSVLDGEAVRYNLNTCRASIRTANSFAHLGAIEVEDQIVRLTFSVPVARPSALLRAETCGMMLSPDWLRTLPSNPLRVVDGLLPDEETINTEPTGDSALPVGSGPFVAASYDGGSLLVERNDRYWRGTGPDSVTDEGLPHLDEIQFRVEPDAAARAELLIDGDVDLIHTVDTADMDDLAEGFTVERSTAYAETDYLIFNEAGGLNDTLARLLASERPVELDPNRVNVASPLRRVECRRALAAGLDREGVLSARDAVEAVASGPFTPGALGHLDDAGLPAHDPEAAAEALAECLDGDEVLSFRLTVPDDAYNQETGQLLIDGWAATFGDQIEVTLEPVSAADYVQRASTGDFEAQLWRNHAGVDPDEQFLWWFSGASLPIGQAALNIGRFVDSDIDDALFDIRAAVDGQERVDRAEALNRALSSDVHGLWLSWTTWAVASSNVVQDVTESVLPNGQVAAPLVAGKHDLAQIWCADAECATP